MEETSKKQSSAYPAKVITGMKKKKKKIHIMYYRSTRWLLLSTRGGRLGSVDLPVYCMVTKQ